MFSLSTTRFVVATILLSVSGFALPLLADDEKKDESQATKQPVLHVAPCDDFQFQGTKAVNAWKSADWVKLNRRSGKLDYEARIKMLYSKTGLYVLFEGSDELLTASITSDFKDLWHEDVFECFFWPDERNPIYFEYEISPLGYELPILVPKLDGKFLGWRPWHYEGKRRTRKRVTVLGGEQESKAKITGWRAEVFIPYDLLKPLQNTPPKRGTKWRANFYRVDHDNGLVTAWDWARVGPSFHDIENFGAILFD